MMVARSAAYIAGWSKGYALAARHACWRPGRLWLAFALSGLFLFGVGLGLLWAGAEVFFRNTTGEPAKKVVVGKWDAWWRVHRR